MSPLLKSRSLWVASFAAWIFFGLFIVARDLLLIGPNARTLALDELIPFAESMLLWALLSPPIVAICEKLSLERGRLLRSLTLHAACAFLICVADVLLDQLFNAATRLGQQPFVKSFYEQVFINHFSYAAVAAAGYAWIRGRDLALNRARTAELERHLVEARLEALASKLQPHFLFNSLNSIAALIRLGDNQQALAALLALSDLLRVVLATGGDARVPLEKELEWVERYLKIERMRFENRLKTEVHVDRVLARALVPALVLQPFVENAIRHGIEQRRGAGLVSISAERDGDYLSLVVQDAGEQQPAAPDQPGFGIGLESTRQRLAHLYGEKQFALDVEASGNHTTARIRVPFMLEAV
jgi:two-component system, LytTR family, sensor kinase